MHRRSIFRELLAAARVRDTATVASRCGCRAAARTLPSRRPISPRPRACLELCARDDARDAWSVTSAEWSSGANPDTVRRRRHAARADDAIVREMMARGMRTLTGAGTTRDAWRRFFDAVGRRRHQGQLRRLSALRLARTRSWPRPSASSTGVGVPAVADLRLRAVSEPDRTSATTRRICRQACRSSRPSAPTGTSTTAATIPRPISRRICSGKRTRART